MNGKICKACGTLQVIKDNGNYFLGKKLDAEIIGTIDLCIICEIAGTPENDQAGA
jgi:hypothetical protein